MTIFLICTNCGDLAVNPDQIIKKVGCSNGIGVLLEDKSCQLAIELVRTSEFLIYVQIDNDAEMELARKAADEAGFFGSRIFVEKGLISKIHLADNIADFLIVADKETTINEAEALRVLRPQGIAFIGSRELIKKVPAGIDEWSHPYHGPDNNPQSNDKVARAPYLTQFLAEPYYTPLPQVAVASNGRVFKAYGNIAFHKREEALLNSLVAYNGYNGTILWKRKLSPGYMIHRNTMIASPEVLYVGDDQSCKIIDAASGKLLTQIIPSVDKAGGTFWKWMAMENGILYALIGDQEQKDPIVKTRREQHGWPWDPLSKGFNEPENPWGYGRNLLAINPKNKKVLWSRSETEDIDSRALCMKNGRIYFYRHGEFLVCLDAKSGKDIWRKTPKDSPDLFEAIGGKLNRQDFETNWRTTAYLKASDQALYFAGPTIGKLLAVSAKDGTVLWEDPYNNFQIIIRDDGLYGISGEMDMHVSKKFDPLSGEVLEEIDTKRRACTRPTGSVDAIFYRASVGSIRLNLENNLTERISPMRAQCHDGVTIANGLLYWWPSVCDCPNTLYGITCLSPAGDFNFFREATEKERLVQYDLAIKNKLERTSSDWPTFRSNNYGDVTTNAKISEKVDRIWWYSPDVSFTPTAPVTAGDLIFLSGSDGIVRALEVSTGNLKWKSYTGGPIRFPPTIWEDRLLVGSGDGWVYAFEAMTGRLLWKFNAAPVSRKIPVYGSLMSTWPVSSGVIVEDGIVYFAAGIVNYDGTHIYALDAATGSIRWQNNSSGRLDTDIQTGICVQGHLLINDNKLYLAGGTTVSPAIFDLKDGRCLNSPAVDSLSTRGMELYKIGDQIVAGGQPLYGDPEYSVLDFLVSQKILHTSADNKDVMLINNKTIMAFKKIDKQKLNKIGAGVGLGEFELPGVPLWEYDCKDAVAMVRCKNAILFLANHTEERPINFVRALDINTGKRIWSQELISPPLDWGLIVDHEGRIIVTLKDGQIMCFS